MFNCSPNSWPRLPYAGMGYSGTRTEHYLKVINVSQLVMMNYENRPILVSRAHVQS
jgi:hypothetical protein